MLDKVWGFRNPKFDLVYQIGEKLDVDLVAMYEFDITNSQDEMKIYLVNIKKQIEYHQSIWTEGCFSEGSGYIEELDLTRKIFEDSLNDLK